MTVHDIEPRPTSRFRYQAYGPAGRPETGHVEAADEADAIRKLSRAGRTPFRIDSVGAGATARTTRTTKRPLLGPRLDITRFLADLSVMLASGFTIDVSLKALADAETAKGQRMRIVALRDQITEGKSVAQAFAAQPDMPSDVVALLASGESSGRLDVVVAALARSYADAARRRSEATEALLYPGFLVIVMFGAMMLLSLYLVPALRPIFDNAGVPVPTVVALLGGFGDFVLRYGLLIATAAIALVVLAFPLSRTRGAREAGADLVGGLPLLGRLMRNVSASRYLTILGLLLGNGVAMLEAMALAADTAFCRRHRAALLAARQKVASGEPLSQALAGSGLFADCTISLLRLGEESNSLAAMATRTGATTGAQLQRLLTRSLTFLTPAVTITLGGLVGILVISVMTTLLSVNEIAIR